MRKHGERLSQLSGSGEEIGARRSGARRLLLAMRRAISGNGAQKTPLVAGFVQIWQCSDGTRFSLRWPPSWPS